MIENVVRGIGGVGIFGIISICIFFAFFTGMVLWSSRLKTNYLNSMGELPLDSQPDNPNRPKTETTSSH